SQRGKGGKTTKTRHAQLLWRTFSAKPAHATARGAGTSKARENLLGHSNRRRKPVEFTAQAQPARIPQLLDRSRSYFHRYTRADGYLTPIMCRRRGSLVLSAT
ncbi:unnamed protein product, partial [Ectocarpus sp. 12 AP-2014]